MRDADRSDLAIERLLTGDAQASPLAAAVRAALHEEVSPPSRRAHLAAIERTAESRGPVVVPLRRAGRSRGGARRLATIAVAASIGLTLFGSSALAAGHGSAPGHPFYGLKRAAERLSLAMHRTPSAKAALHLRFAERRLEEIQVLLDDGRDVSVLQRDYSIALAKAESLAGSSNARSILGQLEEGVGRQIERLNEVLQRAPESARKGLETALTNASKTRQRMTDRRNTSGSNGRPLDRPTPKAKPSQIIPGT